MDGKTQRVNQVLEYMLRMYVMDKPSKWEDYLHLVEFAYNNNFQFSAGMSPFEILYGCKCNTPISWSGQVDRLILQLDLLKDMEITMKQVQQNLNASQERKKIYVDLKGTPRDFHMGEHVYINENPNKCSLRWESIQSWHPGIAGHLNFG